MIRLSPEVALAGVRSCLENGGSAEALDTMKAIMADAFSAGQRSVTSVWACYESEYDDDGELFLTKGLAEEWRDRKTGGDVLFIDERYVHTSPLKEVRLYCVVVNDEGKPHHASPERLAKPGHEIKTNPLGFSGRPPSKFLRVHVEAKDRAEALENALRVARGVGFIG